jgi:hypothetical protein
MDVEDYENAFPGSVPSHFSCANDEDGVCIWCTQFCLTVILARDRVIVDRRPRNPPDSLTRVKNTRCLWDQNSMFNSWSGLNFHTERRDGPSTSSDDPMVHISHTGNASIAKLPNEIFLWIFDFYRQSFGHQLNSERDWNSKKGWFKLTHVCRTWRSIILLSPSRLRLRLYFTDKTRTRATVLMNLPPLPIIVDCRDVVWTEGTENRLKSVRRYRNRVCGIAIAATPTSFKLISDALNTCFPILESLELHINPGEIRFVPKFLMNSMQSLRRLKIRTANLPSLPPLLSATTSLVDLTLTVDTVVLLSGDKLRRCLRCLPCLRHLDVCVVQKSDALPVHAMPATATKMNDIVILAELIDFRCEGHLPHLEELVAGLAFPYLQGLHVLLFLHDLQISQFQIPHLTKLVHDAGMISLAAELKFSTNHCNISLLTHRHLVDEPPFNITIIGHNCKSIAQIGGALSALLDNVEDVLVGFDLTTTYPSHVKLAQWQGFFKK